MKCPNCNTQKSLYKEYDEEGKEKIICVHCKWESSLQPHHAYLELPTIQELKEQWS